MFSTGAIAKNDDTYPSSGWFGSASDVPVFPPISYPFTCAFLPPPFSTTECIISLILSEVSFDTTFLTLSILVSVIVPVFVFSICFTSLGVTNSPLFANADAARTICIGVILNLCPNDIVANSIGPTLFSGQNVLFPSLGKSIPVLSNIPNALRYL